MIYNPLIKSGINIIKQADNLMKTMSLLYLTSCVHKIADAHQYSKFQKYETVFHGFISNLFDLIQIPYAHNIYIYICICFCHFLIQSGMVHASTLLALHALSASRGVIFHHVPATR